MVIERTENSRVEVFAEEALNGIGLVLHYHLAGILNAAMNKFCHWCYNSDWSLLSAQWCCSSCAWTTVGSCYYIATCPDQVQEEEVAAREGVAGSHSSGGAGGLSCHRQLEEVHLQRKERPSYPHCIALVDGHYHLRVFSM